MGCAFAGNHVAARVAFDDGAGVLLAILMRSGGTLLVLAILVLWQRQSLRLPAGAWRWQLLLGLLITAQSLCLYSAVARVPVALALLVANVFPILLALLTWALGGPRPSARTATLMGLILLGLVFVLDVPGRLSTTTDVSAQWLTGAQSADHFHRVQQRQPGRADGRPSRRIELARHLDRMVGPRHFGSAVRHRFYRPVHFGASTGHAAQCAGHEHRAIGNAADGLDCAGPDAQ
jgi:uncharacterized membrane protein